jgi:hypothetical protein
MSEREMQDIIRRAKSGDESVMPALRGLLDQIPEIRELLGSEINRTVEYSLCKALAGDKHHAFYEAIKRKLAAMRAELEGDAPSALESLLVDRIAACWLQVHEIDLRYAQAGECSQTQMESLVRRQNGAHKRYLSAVKALAVVRKLGIPSIQVNIGKNQLNVASVDNLANK